MGLAGLRDTLRRRLPAFCKVACALLLLLVVTTPSRPAGQPLRIAVGEWPPYFSEDAPGSGSFAQVVAKAFALEGIEVEFGFFPWKRALLEVQEGRWQASAGWGRTPDREPYFHFCDPVLMQREQFFYYSDRPVAASRWSDLEGLSVGALAGAALGEPLEALAAQGSVTVYRQALLEDLFKMLRVGRVDLVMGNELVAAGAIASAVDPSEADKFAALEALDVQWDYRVIVSKKTPGGEAICKRFNDGLATLRKSGEYDRILRPEKASAMDGGII